jgi:hypothetical protein
MKLHIVAALLAVAPLTALADNIGGCGWGSKALDGQSGIGPQVLAATTNGILGNQTFGISFGTSGCTQDGTVKSNWKTAAFIDGNKAKLARDLSRGQGETLDALATVIGVEPADRAHFFRVARANFDRILPTADADTDTMRVALRDVVAADPQLAKYVAAI